MKIKARAATVNHSILCEQCACYFEFPASKNDMVKLAELMEHGRSKNYSVEIVEGVLQQQKKLMAELTPHYCPQCGWMQRSMIPVARKQYRQWMFNLALFILPISVFAFAVCLFIGGERDGNISLPVGFSILCTAFVSSPILMIGRRYAASRYDPNGLDSQSRISEAKKDSKILSVSSNETDANSSNTRNDFLSKSPKQLKELKSTSLLPDHQEIDPDQTSPLVSHQKDSSNSPDDKLEINGYRIQAEIARGGMGVIYAAKDIALDRDVVIKLPLVSKGNVDNVISRFKSEARITAKLPHPGVPPVHTSGLLPDGRPYLVMKLIRGSTLADLLRQRQQSAQDLDHYLSIFQQVADTVGFAHRVDIIHRDLKPNNIMVGAFGEVQVMDWGLAREGNSTQDWHESPTVKLPRNHESLTQAGDVLGTLSYMSPEQARGEPVTSRADVFALGVILFEILSGESLYNRQHGMDLWKTVCTGQTTSIQQRLLGHRIDPDLITLVMRCLDAEADKRPGNASEIAQVIQAFRRRGQDSKRDELILQAVNDAQQIRNTANQKVNGIMGTGRMIAAVIGAIALVIGGIAKFANQASKDNYQRTLDARSFEIRSPLPTMPFVLPSSTQKTQIPTKSKKAAISKPPARPLVYMFQHRALRDAAYSNHPELLRALANKNGHLPAGPGELNILSHYIARADMICSELGIGNKDFSKEGMSDEELLNKEIEQSVKDSELFREVTIHPYQREGYTCYVIVMPKPIHRAESYYVAIVHKDSESHRYPVPSPSTSYYTLEYTDLEPFPFLCEWDRAGKHHNYEVGPQPEIKLFADAVFKHYFKKRR